MAAFVTFEDVSKVYRSGEVEIRAVDHISFTIEKGEFCVIVGPSGAGKTTVLNMLGGMDACSGGTIMVDGTRVSGFNARQLTTYRRHDIGFVFQFYNLVGNLTALHALHRAVFDVDHAVGHRRDGAVVRDDHDRHALFPAGILQELQDLLARHIVERAGRLVAEQELGGKGAAR